MSEVHVSVVQDGVLHLFQPVAHLGGRWQAYQTALTGAKFQDLGERGKWNAVKATADGERVASIVGALQAAGFTLRVDEPTRQAVTRGAELIRKRNEEGAAQHKAARSTVAASGGALLEHQDPGVVWLASRRSALLLDEMGLGKTMQTVLSGLPEEAQVVACPASVVGAWVSEFAKWRPDLAVETLDSAREFAWPAPGAVLITTHDRIPPARAVVVEHLLDFRGKMLRWLAAALAGWRSSKLPVLRQALPCEKPPTGPTRVVIDEVHEFRSTSAQRYKNARDLVRRTMRAKGRALGLTGTLVQNRPCELKAVLDLLDLFGEAFGSWTKYTTAFGGPEAVRKSNAEATPAVHQAIGRVALRRTKSSAGLNLPPRSYETITVALEGQAAEAAAQLADIVKRRAGGSEREIPGEEEISAALEASSEIGAVQASRRVIALAKLPAAMKFADECEAAGEPVVIASGCRDVVAALGARPRWGCIMGDQTPKERAKVVARFQAGELVGIAVSTRAGGTGITLTRAAVLLFVDLDWNPARNAQMADRIHRIGQTRPCRIVTLVGDCWIDAAVAAVTRAKRTLAAESLDALVGRDAPKAHAPNVAALRGQPVLGGLVVDASLAQRLRDGARVGRPLASWLHTRWPNVGDHAPGAVRGADKILRPVLDLLAAEEAA